MMRTENTVGGRIPMVRIDGEKIRKIRESKGLTQLYVATVVEVTTDTISRWENRRYPTIKRENSIRLAEALEVELSEILENDKSQETDTGVIEGVEAESDLKSKRKLLPIYLGIGIVLILIVFIAFFLPTDTKRQETMVSASRVLPVRTATGQTFPVVIEIDGVEASEQSIILRESLPVGTVVQRAYPPVTALNKEVPELKWLKKIKGRTRFTYLVQLQSAGEKVVEFSGTVAASGGEVVRIEGDHRLIVDQSHWADSDGDGSISDTEILHVYDEFSEIEGLDVERIERMWAASGYRWNREKELFEIIE